MCGGRIVATNLEETIRYSELLILYQGLLSPTQKDILDDYFSYNLSISEIAENRNISRAAVEDAIKKGKNKLDQLEKELGSLKALEVLHDIKSKTNDEEITSKLDEVERIMKHGI